MAKRKRGCFKVKWIKGCRDKVECLLCIVLRVFYRFYGPVNHVMKSSALLCDVGFLADGRSGGKLTSGQLHLCCLLSLLRSWV